MRALICAVFLMPWTAMADTLPATSRVTAVTIYPQGAQVTREVVFHAAAGVHELLVTDLPEGTQPTLLRVTSSDTELGAFALRSDRLPPRGDLTSPQIATAKAAERVAQAVLREAEAKVAGINAVIEAKDAQIKFLGGIRLIDAAATAEALSGMSQMIATEVLSARKAALAAQADRVLADDAVTEAQKGLTAAQDALAAVSQGDADYVALSVAVTTKGGEGHLTVTHHVEDAAWAPVYDLSLDRKANKVTVERGVLVSQVSGEDWAGVALTLSTARPGEESAPSQLYPQLRAIVDPVPADMAADQGMPEFVMEAPAIEAPAPVMITAGLAYQGDTVVYSYPVAVNVASGVENLRLELDRLTFAATVQARAVPRYDSTAFMMATMINDSPEILLPGAAILYRDGVLVGDAALDAVSPGGEIELGFGAIDGIRLKRDMPERAEGDRGILTTSTQITEKATLEVENLTGEAWPVRVLDQVPYSEQEDLAISYRADPGISEADVDGKRGVLAWDFELAPGESKSISLETVMIWPEGKLLQQ